MTRILISNNPNNLATALAGFKATATVEAEYGSTTVKGSVLTLAHHGENAGNPAPCVAPIPKGLKVDAIGISHFDLDTLGGIMAILGRRSMWDANFYQVAALVDVQGVHHLDKCLQEGVTTYMGPHLEYDEDIQGQFDLMRQGVRMCLEAFWAWSQANRLFPNRDGSVTDCTDFIMKAMEVLEAILRFDEQYIKVGQEWTDNNQKLEEASFCDEVGGKVLIRKDENFVNHLYNHGGKTYAAVVGYNTKTGSVTVSLADPIKGISCKRLVQGLWGEKAGGHDGIAGSPRDEKLEYKHAVNAAEVLYAQMVRE